MTILHKILPDGGFVACDTVSNRTGYAYPTSPYACDAKFWPDDVAAKMIKSALACTVPDNIRDSYDSHCWGMLRSTDYDWRTQV